MCYRTKITLCKNLILTKLKSYVRSALKSNPEKAFEDKYQEVLWQIDVSIIIPQDDLYTLSWQTEFGGHLLDTPILYADPNESDFDETQTQGPDTFWSHGSFFLTQATVKSNKLIPLLTHLQNILQTLYRLAKVKTLQPQQTYIILIVQNKHLRQTQTLKLKVNLCNIHHRGRVTPFRRLNLRILLQKKFRRKNPETLGAVNIIYTPFLIVTTRRYSKIIDVCKNQLQALYKV